jgi:GNAT superfamily N-acetyltransferase
MANRYRTLKDGASYSTRPDGPEDVGFLWDMLYQIACWRPGGCAGSKPPREEVLAYPSVVHYVEGWGRPGDAAVVAVDPIDGRRIGAAWYRPMSPEEPGYGFVDTSTPEVAIAVVPDRRGTGVGKALLQAILSMARSQGFDALSLGVRRKISAAVRLYERNGFVKLFAIDSDFPSLVMKVDLSTTGEAQANDRRRAGGDRESSQ